MEVIYKGCWFFRYLLYRWLFGRFGFPSYLGAPTYLKGVSRVYIGRKARFFPGLRVEVFSDGRLDIGDNTAFGQNIHITCKGNMVIGEGSCIAANVCITDIIHNYSDPDTNILMQEDSVKRTVIGKNCFIGYGAVIDAGTILHDGCVVGANAYVKGVFSEYSVIAGNPAVVVKSYA